MPRQRHPGAVASARQLVSSLRIQAPAEIDIELIANHLGVLIKRRALRLEEGRLVRAGTKGLIVVAESAFSSAKWRFVVAHELGHFVRHAASDAFSACTDGDLSTYLGSGNETEANDFAAELLMPKALFEPWCDLNRPSLRETGALADEFGTSLTATTLRFVEFAPEPCAVVYSVNGVVEWLDWSPNFRIGIKKGTRLTTRTYAGDLVAGNHVFDYLQQVDGEAWSDAPWASDVDLYEHSRQVGPDSVLTFLWHRSR
jgi:Zn-dependent peptidase ImmA (M78 family)